MDDRREGGRTGSCFSYTCWFKHPFRSPVEEVLSPVATERIGSDHQNNVATGRARALDQYFVSIPKYGDFDFAFRTSLITSSL
ncbi:hypothetical protein E2C01_082904 [Portunus trituberculatus]|uniref:Uncharacterized protein n=1 Tax=Portunus trituberculatus TaxID=210409 RepID=A0A5B7IZQ1_PORTR|nr:hypothetical protein [Portunus trituberculatus]